MLGSKHIRSVLPALVGAASLVATSSLALQSASAQEQPDPQQQEQQRQQRQQQERQQQQQDQQQNQQQKQAQQKQQKQQKQAQRTAALQMEDLSQADRQTLMAIHSENQMMIDVAQLAQKRASSPQIKRFARNILQDHRTADRLVKSAAKELKVKLPSKPRPARGNQEMAEMQKKHAQAMQQLKRAKGTQFDQMFLRDMVEQHDMALQKLGEAGDQTENYKVAQLVGFVEPAIKHHQEVAKKLQ